MQKYSAIFSSSALNSKRNTPAMHGLFNAKVKLQFTLPFNAKIKLQLRLPTAKRGEPPSNTTCVYYTYHNIGSKYK